MEDIKKNDENLIKPDSHSNSANKELAKSLETKEQIYEKIKEKYKEFKILDDKIKNSDSITDEENRKDLENVENLNNYIEKLNNFDDLDINAIDVLLDYGDINWQIFIIKNIKKFKNVDKKEIFRKLLKCSEFRSNIVNLCDCGLMKAFEWGLDSDIMSLLLDKAKIDNLKTLWNPFSSNAKKRALLSSKSREATLLKYIFYPYETILVDNIHLFQWLNGKIKEEIGELMWEKFIKEHENSFN